MDPKTPDQADPTGLGPAAPCILVLTDGRTDLCPVQMHPLLNAIDWFRLDLAPTLPPWLDAVYHEVFYPYAGEHIPAEVREAAPPQLAPGTVVVLVDFAGLQREPELPCGPRVPAVRVGVLTDPKTPLTALPEVMVLPGMTLTAAVGSLVDAQLIR